MTGTITTAMTQQKPDRLMNIDQVADFLGGVSTRTVRRLVLRGDFPKPLLNQGRVKLWSPEQLRRWKSRRETAGDV